MTFMQTICKAYVKAKKAGKSKKHKSMTMTLATIPTVDRKLGASRVLV
jgi:hypothetical protein